MTNRCKNITLAKTSFRPVTMTSPTAASPSLTTRRRSVALTTFTVCYHGVCDVSRHDVGREASDTSGSRRHLSASCVSENFWGIIFIARNEVGAR